MGFREAKIGCHPERVPASRDESKDLRLLLFFQRYPHRHFAGCPTSRPPRRTTWDSADLCLAAFPSTARRAGPRSATLRPTLSVAAIFAKAAGLTARAWLTTEGRLATERRLRFTTEAGARLRFRDSFDLKARLGFAVRLWLIGARLEGRAWCAVETVLTAILSRRATELRPITAGLERCAWCAAEGPIAAILPRSGAKFRLIAAGFE